MTNEWSKDTESHFSRTKLAVERLGQREGTAAEIAADKVTGNRAKSREPGVSHGANGRKPLEHRTTEELYLLARQRNIPGRSRMNKSELISALMGETSR